ncbi:MAG: fluoride efflux transporter CrcB [Planctomycetaceae bacterium]|nr:fluoride efflux transporter CrcB [Planctomycetaceae bacterium]
MGQLTPALLVAIGGALGAVSRYAVNGWAQRQFPTFAPTATLIVNVIGCLAIGIVMALLKERQTHAREIQALVVTGFLGGLTTFSAFGYQTVELLVEQQVQRALLNVAANVLLGCGAVWLGLVLTRQIAGS